jgi:murein DD-endopeptidase MepM/ murein hydrolase activator NlpD
MDGTGTATSTTTSTTTSVATSTATSAPGRSKAEREKVTQFAHDFEALLMTQMLKEMRRSMLTDEDDDPGYGAATMTDTIDSELGTALSRSGGVGIAAVLMRALDRQPGIGAPPSAAVSVQAAPALPPAAPAPPSPVDVTAPAGVVTSGFGWRADPITGQTRFHAGTDFRMAYGQDVRAAAGGRVTVAGDQAGYGQTVVLDHGDGLQTRYAHLSGYAVRVGDLVDSGQVVARSGNSGRTTGPHLHFEVLKDGRTVDPGALAGAGVAKDFAAIADSTANRSAEPPPQ